MMRALCVAGGLLVLVAPAWAQTDGPPAPVTVTVTNNAKPVTGLEVRVIGEPPGGGEITFGTGKTDAEGKLMVQAPWRSATDVYALATFDGIRYESKRVPMFGDAAKGLQIVLEVFDRTAGATLADLSLGGNTHLLISFEEGVLDITEVLFVQNNSKATFAPEGGLEIPLPAGFTQVQGVGGEPIFSREHIGAAAPGPFLPGETQVQVRFKLPLKERELFFSQRLLLPLTSARVIIDESPGMEFIGPAVQNQEIRESQGRQLRLVDIDTAGQKIEFTMTGLPYRSHQGRWVALGLASGLLFLGIVFAMGGRSGGGPSEALRRTAESERQNLLADLEQLERDLSDEVVTEEEYEEDRQEILDRLANVLRTLEA